eukprot:3178379-Prorocentrum_lima.AAC.1
MLALLINSSARSTSFELLLSNSIDGSKSVPSNHVAHDAKLVVLVERHVHGRKNDFRLIIITRESSSWCLLRL